MQTRDIEAFGRKVTSTAGHLIGPLDGAGTSHYQTAMSQINQELRNPNIQRRVFSLTRVSPSSIIKDRLIASDLHHRALTYLPDQVLADIPENENVYSLFQGFEATLPTSHPQHRKVHRRRLSKAKKSTRGKDDGEDSGPPSYTSVKREKNDVNHRLEMLSVRKNMCSVEIRDIDTKISNLSNGRKIVLERLAGLEQEEIGLEHDMTDLENRLHELKEQLDEEEARKEAMKPSPDEDLGFGDGESRSQSPAADFMSESIYQKLPAAKPRRPRSSRRKSMPILHEHLEPGSMIKDIQAHNDVITAMDFDAPFGTLVTAALDDTVRVWDLNAGRCMGMLEGHLSSVRCLQVDDNIVATGSMDASIRLWDLNRADYFPAGRDEEEEEDGLAIENDDDLPIAPPRASLARCPLFTLEAHVDEVTALHMKGDLLVSGSADKTLRQWDLEKGRCVQTLDVLWAAAQAASTVNSTDGQWRKTGRTPDASADFVGALQCFDAALACGTADGMVRLWDLRSGQVHRSLVGHTGPVTSLQFDDVHLITGSLDRSIRVSLSRSNRPFQRRIRY